MVLILYVGGRSNTMVVLALHILVVGCNFRLSDYTRSTRSTSGPASTGMGDRLASADMQTILVCC